MIPNPNTRIVRRIDRHGRELVVGVESPVKGFGLRQWKFSPDLAADRALLKAALPVVNGTSRGDKLSAGIRDRLAELGILVPRRHVSATPRLVCALESLGDDEADPDTLVLGAGVRFERTGRVPAILSRRLFVDGLDLSGPTVWVEDPMTRVVFPYRVPARWIQALERLLDGRPIAELPATARSAFHAAGILVSADQLRAHEQRVARRVARARTEMAADMATRPFELGIPPLQLRALQRHCQALFAEGWFGSSTQSPKRVVIHDEVASCFLHRQLGALATAIMGTPWRPSYCYLACYGAGADLAPHVDREQCGLSISLRLEQTPVTDRRRAWPLQARLAGGRTLRARMLDGEAVAFQGTKLVHWRDPLPAGSATYLFLHFVENAFEGVLY
jgi:hypothetical protein